MDQYVSAVIVALITGVFGVISIIVSKRQDKQLENLDKQTASFNKERDIKQKLLLREKERETLMYDVMILTLETNLLILKNTHHESENDSQIFERSKNLRDRYIELTESIKEAAKEYDIVLEMGAQLRQEMKNKKHK